MDANIYNLLKLTGICPILAGAESDSAVPAAQAAALACALAEDAP